MAEAAEVCLFDEAGREDRFRLPDYDGGAWHGFVPGIGPGQAYGFRVRGPYDTARGLRCNPAKLLLDPYARAIRGEVSFGPEVYDYSWDDHDAPSTLDSAGHVPLSLVADAAFDWGSDAPLRRDFADTIIYEVHVKGFTMRHPGVPEELRGTYAGLAHEAVRVPPHRPGRHGRRAAAGAPVRAGRVPAAARADQLLGLQHHRLLRAARRLLGRGARRDGPAAR